MKSQSVELGENSQVALFREGHLTGEALLQFLDGELGSADARVVDSHVHSCWSCRARMDTIARGIADFANFQNAYLAPHMPPSPAGKAVFRARLDALAEKLGTPPLIHFPWQAIRQFFRSIVPTRSVQIAALLLVAFAIPLFYLFHKQETVSAAELLSRAESSEERSLMAVNQPAVVQKLSIVANGRSFTRTIYSDINGKRSVSRTDVSAAQQEPVRIEFAQFGLDWDHPLSVERYRQWRESLTARHDAIERAGKNLIRLDTKAYWGSIAEAALTVRRSDYHPVEERLRSRDNNYIEIAELSYAVVEISALDPNIFGVPASVPQALLPLAASANILSPVISDDARLAITEVQVRSALHSLGADLGEHIDISQTPDGQVLVAGIIADDARRRQLIAALQSIPHTRTQFKTVSEVEALQPAWHSSTARVTTSTAREGPPLLEAQLRQRFPNEEKRSAYVNQVLALAQSAAARAWALNRLAERYGPQQTSLLDASSRESLHSLVRDHLTALQEDMNHLQNQLDLVLSPSSKAVAAIPPKSSKDADDWRDSVHRVHSSVETINESVAVLLSGSDDKDSPEIVEVRLRITLTQLQGDLQALDHQISRSM